MAASKGIDIGLTWGGVAVDGLREKGIECNGEGVDVTSDDDAGKRKLLTVSAQDEVNLSISGVTKSRLLLKDWMNGNRTKTCVITYPDGATITGDFYMASYTDTGPYNDAVTFEATLQSSGNFAFAE